jgi:CubicO group peptidase (beta-lactamase class C family)
MPGARIRRFATLFTAILILLFGWRLFREPDFHHIPVNTLGDLERELEALRVRVRIPGMSAAIADNGRIVWARGFGTADLAQGVAAGEETIYHLASLTKPYASTVLLQIVQEGRLDLEAPVSQFGITMPDAYGSQSRRSAWVPIPVHDPECHQ